MSNKFDSSLKTFYVCVGKDMIVDVKAFKASVMSDQTHDLCLMGDQKNKDMANCVARFSTWLYYKIVEDESHPVLLSEETKKLGSI